MNWKIPLCRYWLVISKRHTTGIKWIFSTGTLIGTSDRVSECVYVNATWMREILFHIGLDVMCINEWKNSLKLLICLNPSNENTPHTHSHAKRGKESGGNAKEWIFHATFSLHVFHSAYGHGSHLPVLKTKTSRKNRVEVVVVVASKLGLRKTESFNWNVNLGNR